MMSLHDFETRTFVKDCGRGKELTAIDERLGQVNQAQMATLTALLTAVEHWIVVKEKQHRNDSSDNYRQRRTVIDDLRGQVIAALGADGVDIQRRATSFEKHKLTGARPGLKKMEKGYDHERNEYLEMKGDKPGKETMIVTKGASFVSGALKNATEMPAALTATVPGALMSLAQGKRLADLKSAQFDEISRLAPGTNIEPTTQTPLVHFLRKTERIGHFLTWCENSLFYKQVGNPYSTPANRRDIYAMDRYGNLITMPFSDYLHLNTGKYTKETVGGNVAQHNHSSLNAGADVISAGMIEFQNGFMTYIDNQTGHYKTKPKYVQNCVRSLFEADGADFSRLTIRVFTKQLRWNEYRDWRVFLMEKF